MKLQNAGEREDRKLVQQARDANESRRGIRMFRAKHGAELNKGEDVRNNKKLIEAKKRKMLQTMRESKTKKGSVGVSDVFTGGKRVSEKAKNKILANT